MTTVKFQLETLTCPSCVKKIESTLLKQAGVKEATVWFHSSKVKAEFDEGVVTAGQLEETITKLGFPVLASKNK